MQIRTLNILAVLLLVISSCTKEKTGGKNSSTKSPDTPGIVNIEFKSQASAEVTLTSEGDLNEVTAVTPDGSESSKESNGDLVTMNVPFGEVLQFKARSRFEGSADKSDYSALGDKYLASMNVDKELDRIELLEAINKLRTEGTTCGGNPTTPVDRLVWHDQLEDLSLEHADDAFKNNLNGSTGSDGRTFKDRLDDAAFQCQAYREFVYTGASSIEALMSTLMSNTTICNILVSDSYNYLGAGKVQTKAVIEVTE